MPLRPFRLESALTWVAVVLGLLPSVAEAQGRPPVLDGLEFQRFAGKSPESLAQKPGGLTERIEVQSTDDHIDYVVKAYVLKEANAAEVFQLVLNAVQLEGGFVDRIAAGSLVSIVEDEDGDGCGEVRTEYQGESILVVTAPDWMIPYLDQTIAVLDQADLESASYGTGYTFVRPRHRRASEIIELISTAAASGVENFVADDSRNTIYLEDTPNYLGLIMEAFAAFDRPPDQVEVRVRIYEVDETKSHDVGLDWLAFKKSIAGGRLLFVWGEPGETNLNLESLTAFLSFHPMVATEFLNYLSRRGNARVITDTRLRVVNGETATLESVLRIPYVLRGFVDNDVFDSPHRDSPEALDADRLIKEFVEGVIITLTPTIATESMEMAVEAAVTSHVGYTPNQSVPIITESAVTSVLDLSNDVPAVLGGLTRRTMIDERVGIPWLKDVPGVRYLFSREVRRQHVSHIIISIEPSRATPYEASRVADPRMLPADDGEG